jgi:hypothetical protein
MRRRHWTSCEITVAAAVVAEQHHPGPGPGRVTTPAEDGPTGYYVGHYQMVTVVGEPPATRIRRYAARGLSTPYHLPGSETVTRLWTRYCEG